MTPKMFLRALRGYCNRRRFRRFAIELTSGSLLQVPHPEAVIREGNLFVFRLPDGRYEVFAAANVARLFDVPPLPPPS